MKKTERLGPRHALGTALAVGVVGSGLVLSGLTSAPRVAVSSGSAVEEPVEHDHDDHDHATHLGDGGRFTGQGEVWPPQPRGARDVVELDFSELAAGVDEAVADQVLADRAVADALGDRYTLISVTDREIVPGRDKDAADSEATLALYFSLDRAQTVEVYVIDGAVVELAVFPAGERQPPLSAAEKARAAELARAHWLAAGDDRVAQLEGFTILANQADGSHFDSRMAYVSFHVDDRSRPELLTWVDLTTETVTDARIDR